MNATVVDRRTCAVVCTVRALWFYELVEQLELRQRNSAEPGKVARIGRVAPLYVREF